MKLIRSISMLLALSVLSGCNLVLFNPSGDVAAQQGDLIIYATVMMMLIIVPVLGLTLFFAFKYRESNKEATYEPDWDHSISLEVIIWSAPLAIIICLAGLTWVSTHRLDPYQPLTRIDAETPIDESVEPMVVQVVSMDWKWLFIYPEYGIASVNEVATIVDRPVEFQITSATVMNAFYIPEMAGMIYAMAGMQTELNAVLNAAGKYEGIAANYNGAGFSHMNFDVHAFEDEAAFDEWVNTVRDGTPELDRAEFVELEVGTVDHPIEYFGSVEEGLWDRILNLCVAENTLCQNDMMMVDALGGGGIDGLFNRELFAGICSVDDPRALLALIKPEQLDNSDAIIAAILPPKELNYTPATSTVAN